MSGAPAGSARRTGALLVAVLAVVVAAGPGSPVGASGVGDVATAVPGQEPSAAGPQLPIPTWDPETPRAEARDILAGPAYQIPEPSVFERIQRWILERIAEAFERLGNSGAGSFVSWILLVAGIGAIVALVLRTVRTVRRDPAAPAEAAEPPPPDAARWLAEAVRCEAAGQWREALRCRYRALVTRLGDDGLLTEVPGRTTGEERAELAVTEPDRAPAFAEAVDLFERTWYGNQPAGPDESARFAALAEQVAR